MIWKNIIGYEGSYIISEFGDVISLERIVVMKNGVKRPVPKTKMSPTLRKDGYLSLPLGLKNKRKTHYIHILVACAFLGHTPDSHNSIIDHIDNDRLNNHKDNLQITNVRHNTSKDQFRHNRTSKYIGVSKHCVSGKWQVYIRTNGKNKNLGMFNNELQASEAYQVALNNLKNG